MRRLAIGSSGASGLIGAVRILQMLHGSQGIETGLGMGATAGLNAGIGTGRSVAEIEALAGGLVARAAARVPDAFRIGDGRSPRWRGA